jgi:hypothetical protein
LGALGAAGGVAGELGTALGGGVLRAAGFLAGVVGFLAGVVLFRAKRSFFFACALRRRIFIE